MNDRSTLVLAYGNPAREDDGIGPAAAEYLESLELNGVTVDTDYQLAIEDALIVAEHDCTIFVDASMDGEEPYSFTRLNPEMEWAFTTHAVDPGAINALANTLFGTEKECYLLGIRGYSFTMFKEEMTEKASNNLNAAMNFLVSFIYRGNSRRMK